MPKDEYITGGGPYYRAHQELIQSEAVRDLSSTAHRLFTEILMSKNYFDDHEIFPFTFIQAKRCKVCASSETFTAAKKNLVENGLIDQIKVGGGRGMECAMFKLSGRWRLYGKENFIRVEYKPGVGFDNLS